MTTPRRRWFSFSLRTMFVVVTVCGVVFGWVLSERQFVEDRAAYWGQFGMAAIRKGHAGPTSTQPTVPWIRSLFGDTPVSELQYEPIFDEDGSELRRARKLFPEAKIWANGVRYRSPDEPPLPDGVEIDRR